jgi:uncharacterized protein YcfJ
MSANIPVQLLTASLLVAAALPAVAGSDRPDRNEGPRWRHVQEDTNRFGRYANAQRRYERYADQRRPVVVERPVVHEVVVSRPVYVERPVVVHRPVREVVVERPVYVGRPVYHEAPVYYPSHYDERSVLGTIGGAVIGAVIGSQVVHPEHRAAGTVAGAVIGGVIGNRF